MLQIHKNELPDSVKQTTNNEQQVYCKIRVMLYYVMLGVQ